MWASISTQCTWLYHTQTHTPNPGCHQQKKSKTHSSHPSPFNSMVLWSSKPLESMLCIGKSSCPISIRWTSPLQRGWGPRLTCPHLSPLALPWLLAIAAGPIYGETGSKQDGKPTNYGSQGYFRDHRFIYGFLDVFWMWLNIAPKRHRWWKSSKVRLTLNSRPLHQSLWKTHVFTTFWFRPHQGVKAITCSSNIKPDLISASNICWTKSSSLTFKTF